MSVGERRVWERWVHVIPAWYDCLYTPIIESLRPSEKSLCSLWQTDLGQQEHSQKEEMEKESMAGGGEAAGLENRYQIL